MEKIATFTITMIGPNPTLSDGVIQGIAVPIVSTATVPIVSSLNTTEYFWGRIPLPVGNYVIESVSPSSMWGADSFAISTNDLPINESIIGTVLSNPWNNFNTSIGLINVTEAGYLYGTIRMAPLENNETRIRIYNIYQLDANEGDIVYNKNEIATIIKNSTSIFPSNTWGGASVAQYLHNLINQFD